MGYTLFKAEFTDISDEDWLVKVYSTDAGVDLNKTFNLGPDGFRLSYDFEEYDRCKPIVGSRVQFTMYQNDSETATFDAFYTSLSTSEEGTYRVEIYKDQDVTNTLFWVGEILPEQTVIPDEFPNAAITITAVDGLANLKGIKYKNDAVPYVGSVKVLDHLHNVIQKLHVSEIWTATDVELKFFEDFIGKEYKDSIGVTQNKQLQNAKISQDTYYNKDENGDPQFYSCYEVLESLALSFNACVFMSEGSIWWVPLGALQSHASAGLDVANYMLGNGTVTYNTVDNTTIGAIFGSNSAQWEKLAGWERTTVPSFKEVKRTRDFYGDQPVVKDSNYTRADIVASTILDDEDVEYPAGRKFLVSGTLRYEYPGDGTSINGDKIARLKIGVRVRVGDAGGDDRYLLRATTYNANQFEIAAGYFVDPPDTNENDFIYLDANHIDAAWSASPSNYEIISGTFNKRTGTDGNQNGAIFIAFSFLTPEITAATGLQISLDDFTGVDKDGADDSDLIGVTAQFSVADFQAHIYDEAQSQEFGTVDITATNPDTARYHFDQGNTLIGDRVTDADLGTIQISNGTTYLDATEWTNLQSSTASLSINGLGVRERLASNEDAKRIERGTLFKRGSTWIHPYTILTNTEDSSNFYQVSGLTFIAARSEYDLECMYLSRNITGITVANDNSKGTPGGGLPDVLPEIKGPGPDLIVSDNNTKLGFITTDTYGITKVTTSTGGAAIDINLPISKASAGVELISINTAGAMGPVADGASGEFLKTDGAGVLTWGAADGGGGFFGSKTTIKVMPSEWIMNDDYNRAPVMVEDDVANILGVKAPSTSTELYAFIVIPEGFKATHVKVSASDSTTSAVEALEFNHRTGATTSKGTGDLNSLIDITDITSTATANIVIKLSAASVTTVIYGGEITIAAL